MMMEQEPQRVQIGERLFLLSLFAVIGAETVSTIVTATKWFEWTSLFLGVAGFLGVLHFASRMYDGDSKGLSWLRMLVGVVLGLLTLGLVLLLADVEKPARWLGVNVVWMTCLKMVIYGLFAAVLFSPGKFEDFLAARRGETVERLPPAGPPLDFPADQTQTLGSLVNLMRAAGGVLIFGGAVEILLGLEITKEAPAKSLLDLIAGFATLCLGAMIITTAGRFRILLDTADRNTGHLAHTLASLGTFLKAQLALGLIAGIVLACRILLFLN